MPDESTATAAGEPSTSREMIDDALSSLRAQASAWSATGIDGRIDLLSELLDTALVAAPAWVEAARLAKDLPPDAPAAGEEWLTGIVPVLRHLSLLRRTLTDIRRTGRPQPPGSGVRADGQVVVQVHPAEPYDRLLFARHHVEARLATTVTRAEAEHRMGRAYRDPIPSDGAVAAVLGAGNLASIAPMDALTQLFEHDRVVLLKMSPVNSMLGPHIAEALEPLIGRGVMRIVYGDAEVGDYLASHPQVDALHVTGSRATYDAVVYGPRADMRASTPRTDKVVTAELESVTPVIVVPGPWSRGDIRYQGDHIASMLVANGGFNCVAARVVVQHRAWASRRALLDAIRDSLSGATPRRLTHPGARERWEQALAVHPEAERFGPDDRGVPFTLVADLDPTDVDDPMFTTDPFCAIAGEVALDAPRSIPEFLETAVRFCNEVLAGSLAVSVLVHPRSLLDAAVALAVERAIDDLDYGVVSVNTWPGLTFGLVAPPWGPAPARDPSQVGSGTGFVHNTYLLADVVKTVHRAPFREPVTPPWFHTHGHPHRVGPALARLAATGDRSALAASALWGVRG